MAELGFAQKALRLLSEPGAVATGRSVLKRKRFDLTLNPGPVATAPGSDTLRSVRRLFCARSGNGNAAGDVRYG